MQKQVCTFVPLKRLNVGKVHCSTEVLSKVNDVGLPQLIFHQEVVGRSHFVESAIPQEVGVDVAQDTHALTAQAPDDHIQLCGQALIISCIGLAVHLINNCV